MRKADIRPYARGFPDQFKRAGIWRDETVADLLARHAAKQPNKTAIVSASERLGYGDLERRVRALGSGLKGAGVRPGDVVAVQLPNVPEFLISYLATIRIGAVLQTIHMPYRAAELETLLQHSQAKVFICPHKIRDYAAADQAMLLKERVKTLQHVIVYAGEVPGALRYAELANTVPRDLGPVPRAEEPALLLYTSGTTASPRGVVVDHRPFLGNARVSLAELGITAEDALLTAAPLSHLYGLFTAHMALVAGAATLLLPQFSPQEFSQLVFRGKPSMLFTAPAHCNAMLRADLLTRDNFASVRGLVISGSACPPELAEAVAKNLKGGKVMQLWGMTEIQAGAYTRMSDPEAIRHLTVGRASPGNEIRIAGENGKPAAAGVEGEVQIRGASVFTGYFADDQANAAAFADGGWFRSGDLGTLDAQGNLTLTGRSKDIINRAGVKYNPADIEALIVKMPGVQHCAIVPVPDPELGEKACAFVQLGTGAKITLELIGRHLDAQKVARIKWPERLEIVQAMPLTPTNKVIKSQLKPPGA